MTPAARIEAAIELLARIDAMEAPADNLVGGFFRSRRFIGSKDRRAISALVYTVLRGRARLDWWIERSAPGTGGVRGRVLAALVLVSGHGGEEVGALFDGGRYHPVPLTDEEARLVAALQEQALDHPEQPDWVRGELPEWLLPRFRAALGVETAAELAALGVEAPLDLRVNRLKAGREEALAALRDDGIEAAPTPVSPMGIRVEGRHTLPSLRAFRDGWVEVQDEGSQLVALLTDARPGMAVADFCAGAGGKTLALAAAMEDRGELFALDVDERRLARARPRLARAGVTCAELRPLAGLEDPWLEERAGSFDRVLVDVPCTGSGAWRRQPAARWQLNEAALGNYVARQRNILGRAAALVAPSGRLVYATCSFLPEENREQIAAFGGSHPEFTPLPLAEPWAAAVGGACPAEGAELLLTPARHGTDGFFLAVLERRAG